MSNSYFQFKQFRIEQGNTAMKVSTDACIQGAWTPIAEDVRHVLDIGTGTGLLSLMLAQRNQNIRIDAVELDAAAASQAEENIKQSPWKERINIIHGDINNIILSSQYDLIICNPPFFRNSLLGDNLERNIARHAMTFSYSEMFTALKKYLKKDGYASVLLPPDEYDVWQRILNENNWQVFHQLRIRPRRHLQVNRIVSLCGPEQNRSSEIEELIIYHDNSYTAVFEVLLQPYYLKL